MTPEGKVKAKIDKLLKSYGTSLYYFKPVQSRWGTKTLDYLCCYRGRFFAIEAKADGEVPTKYQLQTATEITLAGGPVFVVSDPVSLQHLRNCLDDGDLDGHATV